MSAEDGWEARMSARAAERRRERPQDSWNWDAVVRFAWLKREDIARIMGEMTLGDLAENLRREPYACACIGPPFCCVNRGVVQQELQRGAHIMAKLLVDLAAHREDT